MKLKANHWIKYQGEWHKAGDVFTIHKGDAEEMKPHGEIIEEAEDGDETPEETQEEPVRRTRRRKAEATE